MLEVEQLTAHYGSSQVLHGTTLTVAGGECLAVLGRNGMGKTTLVHAITGLHPISSGRVLLDGEDVTAMAAEKRNHAGMALVPQGHRIFRSLTVHENLAVAAASGATWSIADVVDRFPILGDRREQFAGNLSGGQQQMLALARAMVADAEVVLMDEPSEGLDPRRVQTVAGVVDDLVAAGRGVLLVEQRVAFALQVATRVCIMERGAIHEVMDADAARADPARIHDMLGLV